MGGPQVLGGHSDSGRLRSWARWGWGHQSIEEFEIVKQPVQTCITERGSASCEQGQ